MEAIAERKGIKLNVGDISKEDLAPSLTAEDAPQPLEVASRIVAHIGHRIPGVRKIEKRLEGKDKTAGILSDFLGLAAQLYARNEQAINEAAGIVLASKIPGGQAAAPDMGEAVVDFGAVAPNGNNNGGSYDA